MRHAGRPLLQDPRPEDQAGWAQCQDRRSSQEQHREDRAGQARRQDQRSFQEEQGGQGRRQEARRAPEGDARGYPSLPPRNDRRFAAASPPSKPGAATAEHPAAAAAQRKAWGRSKAAAIEPDAQFVAKNAKPQNGKASKYDFHGQTTANGETMDRDELTAAHKTLPLGSKAVVENLDNGQEVEVRINDRGPFVGGRIIDLSKEAAEQIDMLGDGVAKVIVQPAGGVASAAKPSADPPSQAGALRASRCCTKRSRRFASLERSDMLAMRKRYGTPPCVKLQRPDP